jgi:formylglycine-generating enzyme required for sulfatase activity
MLSPGAQSATQQKACIAKPAELVWVPGGSFTIGSERTYPSERPVREVRADGFWIDKHEVTNRQFAKFVQETNYVTLAERKPEPLPNAPPDMLKPGSAVFVQPERVTSRDIRQWWRYTPGADWRHPEGSKSTIEGRGDYPVVHIAFEDAQAYAKWAGRELPTEAQWEYAARAGTNTTFPWGDHLAPGGQHMANTWTGTFPLKNTVGDGYARAAPVMCFPANGFGLYDMIGNVWDWTADIAPTTIIEWHPKRTCAHENFRLVLRTHPFKWYSVLFVAYGRKPAMNTLLFGGGLQPGRKCINSICVWSPDL